MSNSGTMRRRGRPPKAGGPLALLDELLKGAPPELLPEIEANIGKPNDLMRDPAEVAETLARDRAHMLKAARPARARKRTEQERAASVARADRLTVLAGVVAHWPDKSTRNIVAILDRTGRFPGISSETLRKDIDAIRRK